MGPLDGKVAIITGSSRGIGKAIAIELAHLGAHVVVNYVFNEERARELAEQISGDGAQAIAVRADVGKEDEVTDLVDSTIEQFGRLDILVNNAGITRDKTVRKMASEEWQEVIDTNLNSLFLCSRLAVNCMIDRREGGTIINVSSVIGRKGNIGQSNYAASKAGMIGFTKALALEVARYQITVNAVCPGFIETDMLEAVPAEIQQEILKQIPLGRFGRAEEVAALARFLVIDGRWMTGAAIDLNGGMYMGS
jgi:3-oxoacyl-(acyl-carrier-protein) reductase